MIAGSRTDEDGDWETTAAGIADVRAFDDSREPASPFTLYTRAMVSGTEGSCGTEESRTSPELLNRLIFADKYTQLILDVKKKVFLDRLRTPRRSPDRPQPTIAASSSSLDCGRSIIETWSSPTNGCCPTVVARGGGRFCLARPPGRSTGDVALRQRCESAEGTTGGLTGGRSHARRRQSGRDPCS